MADRNLLRYWSSCGLLLLPILAWNAAFVGRLPPAMAQAALWDNIPSGLALAEALLRIPVFGLPFLMPLALQTQGQRLALAGFVVGVLVYFGSWCALMLAPASAWSTRVWGFLAPAYTPALWLLGLAALGRRLFWGRRYRRWMYAALAALFLDVHLTHSRLVFRQVH